MKDDYRNENERIIKHFNELIEKEKLNYNEKNQEMKKVVQELTDEMTKYKNLYTKANKRLFELGSDLDVPYKMKNVSEIQKLNTIESNKNNFTNLKTSERLNEWSKLERQLEDNKNNLKNVFSHKLEVNKFNPIQSQLYDNFMTKKMQEISDQKQIVDNFTKIKENQSKEISDTIFSQLKNDLLKKSMQSIQENHISNVIKINSTNNNNINLNPKIIEKDSNKQSINQDNFVENHQQNKILNNDSRLNQINYINNDNEDNKNKIKIITKENTSYYKSNLISNGPTPEIIGSEKDNQDETKSKNELKTNSKFNY